MRLFHIFFWLFLGATVADAANLDDLIFPGTVLHDDEDATAAGSGQLPAPIAPLPSGSGTAHPTKALRDIVDQDSPSLAADADAPALLSQSQYETTPPVYAVSCVDPAPLHIRLRTLLL